jgi:hypothetical protein
MESWKSMTTNTGLFASRHGNCAARSDRLSHLLGKLVAPKHLKAYLDRQGAYHSPVRDARGEFYNRFRNVWIHRVREMGRL